MPIVSAAEYARQRGISKAAVSLAISEGKLPTAAVKAGRNWKIDTELADREWRENTNPVMGAPTHAKPKGHSVDDESKPVGTETLAASKAKRESFLAELARLEYEQKAGSLVSADDVKKQAFKMARIVRDSILNIPDRVAAELAAETNQFRVHKRLTEELRKALEELGNG
jgi:hypothetical protein